MSEAYSLIDATEAIRELPLTSGVSAGAPSPIRGQSVVTIALAARLSSSSMCAEEHWANLFPQSSTLQTDPPDVRPVAARLVREVPPPTAEQLAAVQDFFGLAKTQLAAVCGVQRQTIYDWYAGKFEAEGDNALRLIQLYKLTARLKASGRPALSARVASRNLATGTTLLDVLAAKDIDEQRLEALVAELGQLGAQQKSRGAAAARERLGWTRQSRETANQVLETNLEDLVDG